MSEDKDINKLFMSITPPASDPISMAANMLYLPFQAVNNMMMANTLSMLSSYQAQSAESQNQSYPQQQTPTPTVQQIKTHIFEKTNFKINGALQLLHVTGSGTISELLLKAPSNEYLIVLKVDSQPDYQRTWTELHAATEDIETITTIHNNGQYSIRLSDIHYSKQCNLVVSGPGITFTKIYMKVDHRE